MIFNALEIAGAYEITLERRGDARGFFARIFCEEEFAELDLNTHWAQANISYSQEKGTLRGMHFQRPPAAEVKMVRCLNGRVLDVFVDLREGSATLGKHAAVVLDAEERNAVYIPEGCAHGFQTLTEDVELQYFHSCRYTPEMEGGVNPLDPTLGIEWPVPISRMSERDAGLPAFSDCEPM